MFVEFCRKLVQTTRGTAAKFETVPFCIYNHAMLLGSVLQYIYILFWNVMKTK